MPVRLVELDQLLILSCPLGIFRLGVTVLDSIELPGKVNGVELCLSLGCQSTLCLLSTLLAHPFGQCYKMVVRQK